MVYGLVIWAPNESLLQFQVSFRSSKLEPVFYEDPRGMSVPTHVLDAVLSILTPLIMKYKSLL